MKRRISSVLFAVVLVLSLSQVTQVIPTALASSELLPEVEFQIGENSSAEWTTEREYAGTYSVLLTTLYPTPLSHYARVATPYSDTLDSISSVSYWEYYVKDWPESVTELWGVYFSIELDTGTYDYPGGPLIDPAFDGVADHWLLGDPHLQGGWTPQGGAEPSPWPCTWNQWVERTFDDSSLFISPIDFSGTEWTFTLAEWKAGGVQAELPPYQGEMVLSPINGDSRVLHIKLAIGDGTAGEGWPKEYKNVYVDDLEINGTTYELEPRVVNSDTTQGFNTIQDAIDAAGTGDTITVAAGTYTENVEVNKQLTLAGDLTQPGNVVVDAGGSGSAITLTADGCVLQGFQVQNGEYGIYVYGSNSNTLASNCVTGNNVGVKIEGADASTTSISFNKIYSNTQYGLENSGSGTADATNNWWGANDGPDDDAGVINGSGDKISTYVDADPWHLKQIGDLTATNATQSSIDLSWTTIGAWDGDYFDVRYSTSTITSGNWNSASQVTGEPTPSTSTASQGMKVNGLSSDTTYYFGLKLIDADIGSSDISNIASATTLVYIPSIPITYQPDNQIKNQGEETHIGDDTYNTDATGQAKSQAVDNNVTATYEIKVENDSNGKDALNVTGTAGGGGWTVTYYSLTEGTDITAHVTAGIWFTRVLAPGASEEMRLEVTPDGTLAGGSSKEVLVTSTSAYGGAMLDAVKATTGVTFIPGDANGDGNINALDITKVERIIAGLDAETPGADANQDGNINALDITKVERIIGGLD